MIKIFSDGLKVMKMEILVLSIILHQGFSEYSSLSSDFYSNCSNQTAFFPIQHCPFSSVHLPANSILFGAVSSQFHFYASPLSPFNLLLRFFDFLSFYPSSIFPFLPSDSKLTVYFIARNIAASDDVSFHFYRRQPQTDPNLHESNASTCGEDREDASAHGHWRMFPHRFTARSALEHHAEFR